MRRSIFRRVVAIAAASAVAAVAVPPARAGIDDALSDVPGTQRKPEPAADDTVPAAHVGQSVIVPIPLSNPTIGSGLAVLGMHFHAQTEEEAKVQPPSVTAAFAVATDNGTKAAGIGHRRYWSADDWRLTALAGQAHVNLDFFGPGGDAAKRDASVRWTVDATVVLPKIYRRLTGPWYAGAQLRYIDARQSFDVDPTGSIAPLQGERLEVIAVGAGLLLERDTRDSQSNAYDGSFFQIDTLFNRQRLGGDRDYDALRVRWRDYLPVREDLVVALDADACARSGDVPLFDRCFLQLRGFPATRFMGKALASAQVEARWRFHRRWGVAAFAGAGAVGDRLRDLHDGTKASSYGVGVRYMVLESQRINLRVDYARGEGSSAVYLAVTEAF